MADLIEPGRVVELVDGETGEIVSGWLSVDRTDGRAFMTWDERRGSTRVTAIGWAPAAGRARTR